MKIIPAIILCFCISFCCVGQSTSYVTLAFIKSKSDEYLSNEKKGIAIHKQLISGGKKTAWFLYKARFPNGTSVTYDYVAMNVFSKWSQVEASTDSQTGAVLAADLKAVVTEIDRSRDVVEEHLFQRIGEAGDKSKGPARYIIVNQMKSVDGAEQEYVTLEQTYFKPFHVARVEAGLMNSWQFYRRAVPYGTKFSYDFVTLNGYASWEDITRSNPEGLWKKVHGAVDFNEIHSRILSKRATVNNELWELVAFVVE